MSVYKKFPLALAACFAVCLFALPAAAQTEPSRPRQVTQTQQPDGAPRLETDVYLVSEAEAHSPAVSLTKTLPGTPRLFQLNHMLLRAIEDRLGAPYVLGTEGPHRFDCSGFVWSVFQSAGVPFERSSARSFWVQFEPVREGEKYKFGTLVFFNNLRHVGIVADEHGFYHASSSQGVKYSPFNEYWTSRITGFRRVPLPASLLAE
jgi:cell wall-associated NlpC family hydrolase